MFVLLVTFEALEVFLSILLIVLQTICKRTCARKLQEIEHLKLVRFMLTVLALDLDPLQTCKYPINERVVFQGLLKVSLKIF